MLATAHSVLRSPILVSNQENVTIDLFTHQYDGDIFLNLASLFPDDPRLYQLDKNASFIL